MSRIFNHDFEPAITSHPEKLFGRWARLYYAAGVVASAFMFAIAVFGG